MNSTQNYNARFQNKASFEGKKYNSKKHSTPSVTSATTVTKDAPKVTPISNKNLGVISPGVALKQRYEKLMSLNYNKQLDEIRDNLKKIEKTQIKAQKGEVIKKVMFSENIINSHPL